MSISILVVDDSRPIAEGFGGKLRRFAEQNFHIAVDVEVLCSSDEAVRRISDESMPKLDLLFTDIDLPGGDAPEKAGVALARFARSRIPGVPVVGYSGWFDEDDLSASDRELFDKWWARGWSGSMLDQISKDALERAISYHQHQRPKLSAPKTESSSTSPKPDSALVTPKTDGEFSLQGYIKSIVEPSAENGLAEPFAIWVKNSEEGVELEVVGCGALFSWGDTYEDAEAGLMEIIQEIRGTLHDPDDSFSQSLLNAKRFVEIVTGSRSAVKGG